MKEQAIIIIMLVIMFGALAVGLVDLINGIAESIVAGGVK